MDEERCKASCGRRVRVLDKDVMESISKLLEEAQKSVKEMKSLLGLKLKADLVVLDHHSSLILNSFQSLFSMLNFHHHSHQNAWGWGSCYKRRKSGESWTRETTDLVDDGHAWRKYGQKQIINTKYPRSYYRCTHKEDEKCEARKQVQQISENPRKYRMIYHGLHTCKNNPSKLLSFQITPNPNPTIKELISIEYSSSCTSTTSDNQLPDLTCFSSSGTGRSCNLSLSSFLQFYQHSS
ncbi:unnamed protein product [Amaranthus hypochondriacus]